MNSNEYLHQHQHAARHREWTARAAEDRLARQIAGPGMLRRLWWQLTGSDSRKPVTTAPIPHRRPGVSVTR